MSPHEAMIRLSAAVSAGPDVKSVNASIDQVIAEYLRSTLCALSASSHSTDATRPVYVTRLVNHVRQQLCPVWPSLDRPRHPMLSDMETEREGGIHTDRIRRVLDDLNDLRDVADLGNGYWLPAPIRLVRLPSKKVLVIGGLSTNDLRKVMSSRITVTWIARVIEKAGVSKEAAQSLLGWQSFDEWLGCEGQDVKSWTQHILEDAKSRLHPSGTEDARFEVYAPRLYPNQPQYFRWVNSSQFPALPRDHLVLCRSVQSSRQWPVIYWLCTLTKTPRSIRMEREARVPPAKIRRLMYGLDLLDGASTQAVIDDCNGEQVLTFRSWLPAEERRLLLALAHDVSESPGRLPLRYRFASEFASDIILRIEHLGIKICLSKQ